MIPETKPPVKIDIKDVSLKYSDGNESLKHINFHIYANKINVIFGPSGGGKSSLLRLFNRLNDLADVIKMEGEVLMDGVNIIDPKLDVISLRRKIGMVFSKPVVLPMSIAENITYGLELAGIRDKKIHKEAIERGLKQSALWDEVKDRLDNSAFALSGGQKQRLCLARALANEPEVIILDEPTSGLDPISTLKVEDSLQQLKSEYTIILVPHSIQQAARTADYCSFFLQGELIEHSTGHVIFTNPSDERTKDYVEGRFG
jgi:phosphate transport system ATP-binding protein